MKPTLYLWMPIVALLSSLLLSCDREPEPEPEPPRYEMPDPYVVPMTSESITPYDKLYGTWVLCGISMNENVEPECNLNPSNNERDTLIFTDSTVTLKTHSTQVWTLYNHTDTTLCYQNPNLVKRIKYRNNNMEMLIYGWPDHYSWSGVFYNLVCFSKIE
ncbi:MAG: hypothetical protein J5741_07075 [Bacteroidales bacterium]|nr:hypothetical protein [Bacteroidales bacterium]